MKKFFIGLMVLCVFASSAFAGTDLTLLDEVVATGVSRTVATEDMETKTLYILAADVVTGGTLTVDTSYDNTNWVTINTQTIAANGVTEIAIVGLLQKYLRVNLSARTDGTYSVYFFGKS